jgi:hypothetical protein
MILRLSILLLLVAQAAGAGTMSPLPKIYTHVDTTKGAQKLLSAPIITRTNTIAWDYTDITIVSNFAVLFGNKSGTYTTTNLTGKVLTNRFTYTKGTTNFLVVIAKGTNGLDSLPSNELRLPPPPLTNCVITISGGVTWSATNPPGMQFFTNRNPMIITKRYQ